MTNETLETIKSRRSCRAYKPEQITDEELNAVLEAGTYAASAMGRQSAKIVVVQDAATRAQLTRMNAAVMGKDTDPMYGAPTILVVLADAGFKNAVQDGSLVMGNLMLAAASLGLGSCWINRAKEEFESDAGLDKIHHRVDQQQLRCEKRQNDDHHKRAAVLRLHDLCDRPRRGVRRNDADERDLARRKERFSHQPPERRGAEHTGDVAQRPARPWLSGKDVAVHKAEHKQHQKRQDRQAQQEDDARRRPQRARTKFGSLLFHFQLPPLF